MVNAPTNQFLEQTDNVVTNMNVSAEDLGIRRSYEPDELIPEITLSMVGGIGSMLTQRLLNRFGNAESVLNATESQLQEVEGIGSKIANNISQAHSIYHPEVLIDQCRTNGISLISKQDVRYPQLLRTIDDPPFFLFVKGEFQASDNLAIAIVGTRNATQYGHQQAERLASELSQYGFTIISGLALGIDGAAHRGALSMEGRTIAVLGSGLLHIFPQEHHDLAENIITHGMIISEYLPDQVPQRGMFPQRNRIISGLSLGVLIIEAPLQSGALITATLAAKQRRQVFAVPGRVDQESSRGCHQLIRNGAILVESVEDLLKHFDLPIKSKTQPQPQQKLQPKQKTQPIPQLQSTITLQSPQPPKTETTNIPIPVDWQLNETETKVLQLISVNPTSIDSIISISGLPAHRVLATISLLEIRQIIRRTEANTVIRLIIDSKK
ncbi:MAG: DNA-processing protein DprA [Planctomycetaceae bacterium]|jgi:DNA processing protein|nr:DNA-processing protein DprA [Planctomycetaceae bacterium]